MKTNLKFLGEIFLSFFKIGSVSFGGGYSMIPLIEREVVDNKKWIDKDKIVDIFAVAGALPGAIAINASTFVGYSIAGLSGAIAAFIGNVMPSVLIVLTLSAIFARFGEAAPIRAAFQAIYPVVVGLILFAAYKIGKTALKDVFCVLLAVVSFMVSLFLHMDPISVTVTGALAGLIAITVRNIFNDKVKTLFIEEKDKKQ